VGSGYSIDRRPSPGGGSSRSGWII
jgi:hypothetical protein